MSKRIKKPAAKKPARSEFAPKPADVLMALLGWWDGITEEFGEVAGALRGFHLPGQVFEFPPEFLFAKEAAHALQLMVDSLDHERPAPPAVSTAHMRAVITAARLGVPGP